jgi:PAS domain S-box-containing protein
LHELSRWYRRSDGVYQRQTAMIIVGALIPWFVNLLYLIGYRPFAYLDLTPFAFMATGFVIAYGLLRFRLFELVPIAREKVIERMTDGVMVLDPLDRIVDVNPAMKRILEAYSPQLIGKHPSDIVPEASSLLELIDQQEPTRMVIALGSRSMQVQATPIFDKEEQGDRSGMLIIWRDVTDQEIFEKELMNAKRKAEESDRLKTAFLANMSHEIRNPMHAILGFTEILRDPDTAEADRLKYTDIIAHSAQKLLGLLNDIIDLSKVEAGQDPISPETGDVNEMMDEVIGLLSMVARKKHIELSLGDLLPAGDALLQTDHRKVRQILINLVSNGIKYTDSGSVTLSAHRVGQHVFFKVKDTGIGMDPKTLTVIFERFRQADEKSGKHIGGTGLGLSISKAYADLLGGLISVESTKGSGSTFTLRIPYKKAIITKETMPTEPDKTQDPIPDLSAFSILLAEDEPVNVKFLQITLKKTKANVIVARNGLEALNIALDQNVDLILMDIMMPEMDGFEASKRIRKQKPNLPILGLSGHAMVEEEKIADAGITELLTKPIQGLDLIRKLDAYLTKTRP